MALAGDPQVRDVHLVALDHGIDNSTAVGRMFFHILGGLADFAHALLSERTVEGLQSARARGRTGGQKPKLIPRQARIAQEEMYDAGEHTVAQIAAEFGVSRPTIYRHLARLADSSVQTRARQGRQVGSVTSTPDSTEL